MIKNKNRNREPIAKRLIKIVLGVSSTSSALVFTNDIPQKATAKKKQIKPQLKQN